MALLGFNLPRIADSSTSKNKEIQEIKEYLHQLTEQLRYILQNIDEDNFNSGFSDALSSEIKNQLSAADAISRNISSSVNTLSSKISSVEGDISNLVVGLNSKVTKPETLVQDDMLIYTGDDWATIQRSELGGGGTSSQTPKGVKSEIVMLSDVTLTQGAMLEDQIITFPTQHCNADNYICKFLVSSWPKKTWENAFVFNVHSDCTVTIGNPGTLFAYNQFGLATMATQKYDLIAQFLYYDDGENE